MPYVMAEIVMVRLKKAVMALDQMRVLMVLLTALQG